MSDTNGTVPLDRLSYIHAAILTTEPAPSPPPIILLWTTGNRIRPCGQDTGAQMAAFREAQPGLPPKRRRSSGSSGGFENAAVQAPSTAIDWPLT